MKEANAGRNTGQAMKDAVTKYFEAVDNKDVSGALALFNNNAEMIVQTDHKKFKGTAAIEGMFSDFFENSIRIEHEILNWVVEPSAEKCATEQIYRGTLKDGTINNMHNCNFFDFEDGKFKRVIIFMSGTNPLH